MAHTENNPGTVARIGLIQSNCDRLAEIADICEKENRDLTDKEKAEVEQLKRTNELQRLRLSAAEGDRLRGTTAAPDADELLRANIQNHVTTHIVMRAKLGTTDVANTGIISTDQQEMLAPLRAGLIYDKVGISIRTGLAGQLRWPYHSKATAYYRNEGERIPDDSITFNALTMDGQPVGCAIPVTREVLQDSKGVVEGVVRQEMPKALIDLVNDTLFSLDPNVKVIQNGTTKVVAKKQKSPFLGIATADIKVFAADAPTYRELLALKAKLLKQVEGIAPCWVMTEDTKAELEGTPVDAGSGRFLCENDKVLGYPVFTTSAFPTGYIGLGDWSYQASGFFGDTELIVDPYTLVREGSVDFVLHARFGTVTLRKEAFVLGKGKTATVTVTPLPE